MQTKIKKITKKSWFYFLGAGGVAVAFFVEMFLGGAGIISLPKLEADAKNAIMQVGVINVASADVPTGGDSDGGTGGGTGDCDGTGDSCGDGGSY